MSNSNLTYHEMKQAVLLGLLHSGWKAVDEISMNHTSTEGILKQFARISARQSVDQRSAIVKCLWFAQLWQNRE